MSEAFDLHWDRGWEFYEAEKFGEAIAEWRKANRIDPEDGYVLNNIGRALSKLEKQEDAIIEWREAVRLEPAFESAHINLVNALSASGYSLEALEAVQVAIKISPKTAGLYRMLGYHLMLQSKETSDESEWPTAEAAFQQAVALDASDIYSYRHLAKIQWHLKRKREAVDTLKAAIKADPIDASVHVQLIRYQGHQKHYRDMYQLIVALNKLPDSEALDKYDSDIDRLWMQIKIIFFGGVGLATLLGLIWLYRRREQE